MTGREAYDAIAEELSGDSTLDDLDPEFVTLAEAYARTAHKKWPPRPQVSGWTVSIRSM